MAVSTKRLALALGLALLTGCADGDEAGADFPAGGGNGADNDGSDGDDGSGDGNPGDDGTGDGSDGLPPEVEETVRFDTPQAGKTALYVPNPATNRVAVVDATTFSIESLRTGRAPTYTATVPGQDVAVVLNVGSADAAVLRTVKGRTTAVQVDVGHEANAIAVAPGGKHAVVYYQARGDGELASTFQDVTVVGLAKGKESSRGVSVGFRPRAVQFSQDGARAFVITEDGVSIIDLEEAVEGPVIARLVSVGDSLSDPVSSDVQITPDGRYALARREGNPAVRLIDLETGALSVLDLATHLSSASGDMGDGGPDAGEGDAGVSSDAGTVAPVNVVLTDLDLSPDGSFALAVVRNMGLVLRIPVPEGIADPSSITSRTITEQLVGSVTLSRTGELAVLYTTTSNVESVVLLDLTSDAAPRGVRLRKDVRAVALSDDGSRALVLHGRRESSNTGAELDDEERIDLAEGYSLVDTRTGFAKLKLTDARVSEFNVLVTPDATRMFALLRNDARGVHGYETADLGSFQVETVALKHPPTSLGLVPAAERVFIGQQAEGGMISFLDAKTGELVRPVAGFELSSGIRQ